MPIKSKSQWRWMHAAAAKGEIPESMLQEWKEHTKKKYKKLPETVSKAAGIKIALLDPGMAGYRQPIIGSLPVRPNVASGVSLPDAQPLLDPTVHAQAPVPQSQQPQQQPQPQPQQTTSSNPPQLKVTAKAGNAKLLADARMINKNIVDSMNTLPPEAVALFSGVLGANIGVPAGIVDAVKKNDLLKGLDTAVHVGGSAAAAPMGAYLGWHAANPHVRKALSNISTKDPYTRIALHSAPYFSGIGGGIGAYFGADKVLGSLANKQSDAQPQNPPQNQPQQAPGAWKPSPVLSYATNQNSPQFLWQKTIAGNLIPQEPAPPPSQSVADGRKLNNSIEMQKMSAMDCISMQVANHMLKQAFTPYYGAQPTQPNNGLLPQLPPGFGAPVAAPGPVNTPPGFNFAIPNQAPAGVMTPPGFNFAMPNQNQPVFNQAPQFQQQMGQGVAFNQIPHQQIPGQQQQQQQPAQNRPQFQMNPQLESQLTETNRLLAAGEAMRAHVQHPQQKALLARQMQALTQQQAALQAMATHDEQAFNKKHNIKPEDVLGGNKPLPEGMKDPTDVLNAPVANVNQPQPQAQQQFNGPVAEAKNQQVDPDRDAYAKHFEHGTAMQKEMDTYLRNHLNRQQDQASKLYADAYNKTLQNTTVDDLTKKNPAIIHDIGRLFVGAKRDSRLSDLDPTKSPDMEAASKFLSDHVAEKNPELLLQQKMQDKQLAGLTSNPAYQDVIKQMQSLPRDSAEYFKLNDQLHNMESTYKKENPYRLSSQDLQQDPEFQKQLLGSSGPEARTKAQQLLQHQQWLEQKKMTWDQYSERYNKKYGNPAQEATAKQGPGQGVAPSDPMNKEAPEPQQPPAQQPQPEQVKEAPQEQPAPQPQQPEPVNQPQQPPVNAPAGAQGQVGETGIPQPQQPQEQFNEPAGAQGPAGVPPQPAPERLKAKAQPVPKPGPTAIPNQPLRFNNQTMPYGSQAKGFTSSMPSVISSISANSNTWRQPQNVNQQTGGFAASVNPQPQAIRPNFMTGFSNTAGRNSTGTFTMPSVANPNTNVTPFYSNVGSTISQPTPGAAPQPSQTFNALKPPQKATAQTPAAPKTPAVTGAPKPTGTLQNAAAPAPNAGSGNSLTNNNKKK